MAGENKIKTREDLVEEVKKCGQSIIDNADSIIGNEKYFLKTIVQFVVQRNADGLATIQTSREFIPEAMIDELGKEKPKTTTKKSTVKKTTKTNKKGGK